MALQQKKRIENSAHRGRGRWTKLRKCPTYFPGNLHFCAFSFKNRRKLVGFRCKMQEFGFYPSFVHNTRKLVFLSRTRP